MIITLLSDFGMQDNSVAVAKGLLMQQLPEAKLIDISHEVQPFNLLQCSYMLAGTYANFPKGTVHLSLFDTMNHHPANILVTEIAGQFIISADNGLLPLAFNQNLVAVFSSEKIPGDYHSWLLQAIMMIKELEANSFEIGSFLIPYTPLVYPVKLQPIVKDNSLECQVMHIDRFENVVVNITREYFEEFRKGRKFAIIVARNTPIHKISESFAGITAAEPYAMFNTAGYLEVSIYRGNAASLFGIQLHNDKALVYQNIKIDFE